LDGEEIDKACRTAAARELFEETGIDVRGDIDRLVQVSWGPNHSVELKGRRLFHLQLEDSDSCTDPGAEYPSTGEPFKLRLSSEHQEFKFQEDMLQAALDLQQHSGGKVSMILRQVSADVERLGHASLETSATFAVEKNCELGCCLCQ